jgi:chromosome segregation ATPase
MLRCKQTEVDLDQQHAELVETEERLMERLDQIETELGKTVQIQDKYMVQQRRLDEKMIGPKAVASEDERAMLAELVKELEQKKAQVDAIVNTLMEQDDILRAQLNECEQNLVAVREKKEAVKTEMNLLEAALEADPGVPVVKISGTAYTRTIVSGVHKRLKLSENMTCVRIAESKVEAGPKTWQIKISNLR